MKEIARIVRRGKLNARVEFTDGVQALIPNELAEIGQEIDSNRLFIFTEYTGKKGLRWKGNNSILYKHQKADKETGLLSNEIWTQFFEVVRAYLCKFIFFWVGEIF